MRRRFRAVVARDELGTRADLDASELLVRRLRDAFPDDAILSEEGPTARGAQLWIVDPHGNLVLRYDSSSKGKAILNDLRHLLKISQIG